MRVRIVVRPTGALNGRDWPLVGETLDVPQVVADDLIGAGNALAVASAKKVEPKIEKRPAPTAKVEKRDSGA
jgi:hypothetical protein